MPETDWSAQKASVLRRLRRAEGQLRAVNAMVEREDDCEKIAQQLAATRKALDRAFFDLMACITRRELSQAGVRDAVTYSRLAAISDLLARYG